MGPNGVNTSNAVATTSGTSMTSVLSLVEVTFRFEGNYTCIVEDTSDNSTATSDAAVLTVNGR